MTGLTAVPVTIREASAFVREHHRHHPAARGWKFGIGASQDGILVAVAMVGRPVSRMLDDKQTLEVNRLCSIGTPNACSFLYARAWAATKALGYNRLITYTLPEEGGASLRASGWVEVGPAGGGEWSRPSRKRDVHAPTTIKTLWEIRALAKKGATNDPRNR